MTDGESCPVDLGPGCLGFQCQTCGRPTGAYALAAVVQHMEQLYYDLREWRKIRREYVTELAVKGLSDKTIGRRAGLPARRVRQILDGAARDNTPRA